MSSLRSKPCYFGIAPLIDIAEGIFIAKERKQRPASCIGTHPRSSRGNSLIEQDNAVWLRASGHVGRNIGSSATAKTDLSRSHAPMKFSPITGKFPPQAVVAAIYNVESRTKVAPRDAGSQLAGPRATRNFLASYALRVRPTGGSYVPALWRNISQTLRLLRWAPYFKCNGSIGLAHRNPICLQRVLRRWI
jgi:hypothetical protein